MRSAGLTSFNLSSGKFVSNCQKFSEVFVPYFPIASTIVGKNLSKTILPKRFFDEIALVFYFTIIDYLRDWEAQFQKPLMKSKFFIYDTSRTNTQKFIPTTI